MGHLLSGVSPTSYLIGNGTGFYENNSKYFVFEACEYKRHFLAYEPDYAIMTNIDFDHPDYYLDINDVFQAFQSLTHNVKKGIIAYGDDQYLCKLDNNNNNINIYYYGIGSENDFQARNIQLDANGSKFDVYCFNKFFGHFQLAIFGFHNILNHLAVISFAFLENIGFNQIINQLNTFKGVTRRFNEKTINNIKIIDDYAHHPTEIKATLLSIRQKYPTLNIISIFQPHTFSRTKTFLNEFANSLDFSNKVYLCDIFGSREYNKSTDGGIIIDELMLKIKTHAGASILTLDNIDILFDNNDNRDCVFVFMGAGDIQKFQKAFEQLCIKRVN
ncbi:hypothetical protein CYY_010588 [Polysphondylium violaceum]|uniref:UDP-N-acetylmuramate--L-alanine ligase n=1 Tax=Polysphondylium violaceum TaxID=133409 RepID=A0A8J4UZN4_9MYCE|nr:hypothetical protein CYY_010588 [Polysphondylium violaceum]